MKYESEALEVVHQDAIAMFKAGVITETRMREYDEMCLNHLEAKQKSTSVYDNSLNIKHVNHATA
jgi:DNA-binding transcriptional regulator YiaG